MSKRIMNMILCKKHDTWVESIQDEDVRKLARENTIITGGAIASMLLKEEIKDFDFYFTNFETCKAITEYYVRQFIKEHNNLKIKPQVMVQDEETKEYLSDEKIAEALSANKLEGNRLRVRIRIKSAGIAGDNTDDTQYQYFEGDALRGGEALIDEGEEYIEQAIEPATETLRKTDEIGAEDVQTSSAIGNLRGHGAEKGKFRPIFLTDNAITLSDKTQLIIRFYGDAEKIHENFDYIHCTNYWRSDMKELVLRQEALESLLAKRLYYVNSKYPICALVRIRKFLKRGFYIDAGQILKMCFQISKLDLNDVEVFNDQLLGMDVAYFQQLINYIQQEKAKNEKWILDLPYLASVIDRIF